MKQSYKSPLGPFSQPTVRHNWPTSAVSALINSVTEQIIVYTLYRIYPIVLGHLIYLPYCVLTFEIIESSVKSPDQ